MWQRCSPERRDPAAGLLRLPGKALELLITGRSSAKLANRETCRPRGGTHAGTRPPGRWHLTPETRPPGQSALTPGTRQPDRSALAPGTRQPDRSALTPGTRQPGQPAIRLADRDPHLSLRA